MTTAPYFDRAKVAAAQVIAGFDADAFTATLEQTSVGISLGDGVTKPQGRACADLLVRLFARLYPTLAVTTSTSDGDRGEAEALATELCDLATVINPNITLTDVADTGATVVHIGLGTPPAAASVLYVGSDGWVGRLSIDQPCTVGDGPIPVGAGVAACLAAGAAFRLLLDPTAPRPQNAELAALPDPLPSATAFTLPDRSALAGAGAIGQAFIWALGRSPVTGLLHVVEPERVDLGNMQRYVLTNINSLGQDKSAVASSYFKSLQPSGTGTGLKLEGHRSEWGLALSTLGSTWDTVAIAVDSAQARRSVQASLPRHVLNAWTQTGDLGVSSHNFIDGACCACLYLPEGATRSEDEIVASALGMPDRLMDVRTLLYTGSPVPDEFLDAVAERLAIDPSVLARFRGVPIRDLYVRAICGGEAIPLGHNPSGNPVHVPLAHQSALAGILLFARMLQAISSGIPARTEVTRLDVRRDPPDVPHQRAAKDPRGICICQDPDYIEVYRALWQ